MEFHSFNVLLNCNDTWEDSHIVDGKDRETRFRMRQTNFGSCRVTVKGVRNGVNVAMGTTSVPSQCPCPAGELFYLLNKMFSLCFHFVLQTLMRVYSYSTISSFDSFNRYQTMYISLQTYACFLYNTIEYSTMSPQISAELLQK